MAPFSGVFTLEVDGRPILTFEASRVREAQQLRKESGLRANLTALMSNGVPLMSADAALEIGPASEIYDKLNL
jgi:hypothetical protein